MGGHYEAELEGTECVDMGMSDAGRFFTPQKRGCGQPEMVWTTDDTGAVVRIVTIVTADTPPRRIWRL